VVLARPRASLVVPVRTTLALRRVIRTTSALRCRGSTAAGHHSTETAARATGGAMNEVVAVGASPAVVTTTLATDRRRAAETRMANRTRRVDEVARPIATVAAIETETEAVAAAAVAVVGEPLATGGRVVGAAAAARETASRARLADHVV